MRIAIIGTRYPTEEQFFIVENMAYNLACKEVEVSSGGADGIDTAAELGTIRYNPSSLYLYLSQDKPKRGREKCNIIVYDKSKHLDWNQSVRKYHPSKGNLPPYIFALHARNYGIVAHPKPVDAIITLPKSLTNWGGTGQGMRIGYDLGIPVVNLLVPNAIKETQEWIKSL
jgi:hypothetical protein